MVATQTKRNRQTMILLAITFVIPIVLAKLALEGDWFNRAATNKGVLLDPILDFTAVYPNREPIWYISYMTSEPCDEQCELALFSLNQIAVALRRERARVNTAVLVNSPDDLAAVKSHEYAQQLNVVAVAAVQLTALFTAPSVDGLYIVDALGNIILRYPLQSTKEQTILKSRDILGDMRKLLKLSRIG